MANAKSKSLDRKKFFGDPILVIAILLIMLFLLLFIVYPLWTVTMQSFSRGETETIAEVKAAGEWFTNQASAVEDGSADAFAGLGERITAYYKEYNKARKNNDKVVAARDEMDAAIAALDQAGIAAAVEAIGAAGGDATAEQAEAYISSVKAAETRLGHFAVSFDVYASLFKNATFMRIVRNTLVLGMVTGLFSTLIGFIFA